MSDRQFHRCQYCGSVSRNHPTPPTNLPQRLRDWMNVPMDDRPEPREWR